MCLIINRPLKGGRKKRTGHVEQATIDYNLRTNPDGFGIAWRTAEGLQYAKYGPTDKEAFVSKLKEIDALPVEYTAHFRFATHGPACLALSHPFTYTDPEEGEVLVFHNGVINNDAPRSTSDTEYFVRTVLSHLPARWWKNVAIRYLVTEAISGSRLVLMSKSETIIIGEKKGSRENGIWYSTYHKPFNYGGNSGKGVNRDWVDYRSTGTASTDGDLASKYGMTGWRKSPPIVTAPKPVVIATPKSVEERIKATKWSHAGHSLSLIGEPVISGQEFASDVLCDICETEGDMFVLEGKVYVTIDHLSSKYDDEFEKALARTPNVH